MIRVTIELLPGGDETKARHLGTALIANDGTGTPTISDYAVSLSKMGKPGEAWRVGRVQGFPRVRLGPWDLLYRCLRETVGSRNR